MVRALDTVPNLTKLMADSFENMDLMKQVLMHVIIRRGELAKEDHEPLINEVKTILLKHKLINHSNPELFANILRLHFLLEALRT